MDFTTLKALSPAIDRVDGGGKPGIDHAFCLRDYSNDIDHKTLRNVARYVSELEFIADWWRKRVGDALTLPQRSVHWSCIHRTGWMKSRHLLLYPLPLILICSITRSVWSLASIPTRPIILASRRVWFSLDIPIITIVYSSFPLFFVFVFWLRFL